MMWVVEARWWAGVTLGKDEPWMEPQAVMVDRLLSPLLSYYLHLPEANPAPPFPHRGSESS